MIKGIKFANVPVSDQDRAISFYTEKLGFVLATDQPFDGKQRWVEMRIPGADTRVVLFTPDGWEDRIGGFTNITFAADVLRTYYSFPRGAKFSMRQTEHWGTAATSRTRTGTIRASSRPSEATPRSRALPT